jgi:hypothetical protein
MFTHATRSHEGIYPSKYLSGSHREQLHIVFANISALLVFQVTQQERVVANLSQVHQKVDLRQTLGVLHLHQIQINEWSESEVP